MHAVHLLTQFPAQRVIVADAMATRQHIPELQRLCADGNGMLGAFVVGQGVLLLLVAAPIMSTCGANPNVAS